MCKERERFQNVRIASNEMKKAAYLRKHMKLQHGDSNVKAAECVESFDDVLDSDPDIVGL